MLTRFWFTFIKDKEQNILDMGCGITAYDRADAEALLRDVVFSIFPPQPIDKVVENIDIRTLDDGHVRPNMGNPVVRGVWYPSL